ncbi:hypothetical protein [Mobilisporobacter senegalensis]|nr:hypothetical protein [Mobilisporobacter senegalensis]
MVGIIGLVLLRKNIYTKGQLLNDLGTKVPFKAVLIKLLKALTIAPFALSLIVGILLFAAIFF